VCAWKASVAVSYVTLSLGLSLWAVCSSNYKKTLLLTMTKWFSCTLMKKMQKKQKG